MDIYAIKKCYKMYILLASLCTPYVAEQKCLNKQAGMHYISFEIIFS